jgi:two-component sensor histidine kinase
MSLNTEQIPEQSETLNSHIMVVDDNSANLKLLEDMLVLQGHEVRSFPLGRLALASAAKNPPDLILLDIDMPEMNGYEVCERLKSSGPLSPIPVIFLIALTESRDKVRAFRSGAVDYISKPFQFEEVHARVRTHLKLHHLQRALTRHNDELEHTVAARTHELAEANRQLTLLVREKELLLQEVHHRVNNNLQVICSLLGMQSGSAGDPLVASALLKSQNRVKSMATVHAMLYASRALNSIDFAEYVHALAAVIADSYGADSARVQLAFHLDPLRLELDRAIPCGLILNEVLSNALTHAFPDGRVGEIRISLRARDGEIRMTVGDDGVGLAASGMPDKAGSLGMSIAKTLARQLGGTLEIIAGQGSQFVLTFPDHKPA